jgi:CO/xanthine dehydrogenase Mo-binding subunit
VAADTKDAAEEAARLVKVEYEELPAVFTLEAAIEPAGPLVRDPRLRPGDPLAATNVLREHRVGWGDLDAARADLVVDHTYRFPMVTQFAIEPHAFIAAPDGDGISVWSTIQHPNWLQKILARVLGLPLAKVRILAPDPGGAFGGKQHVKYEPLVAFMALRAGRPVRLVLTLEETFQAVRRASAQIHVRTGFQSDGTFTFQDIAADYLIGAYADIAVRVVGKGCYTGCGPYRVPAALIVARSILSHTTPSTAFRGFGNPQINWAVESNIDEGALELGIDRLELRLRNLARRGEAFIPFDTPADGAWEQTVRRAASSSAGSARARDAVAYRLRIKSPPAVVLDRSAPRRRQRDRLRGHVGHGPGSADRPRPDRRGRARGATWLGHRRDGRHRSRPL